jgi:hypothetical protein
LLRSSAIPRITETLSDKTRSFTQELNERLLTIEDFWYSGAFHHEYFKPQKLHDWDSESAIDPINPLVYIQANYFEFSAKEVCHNI